MTFDEQEIHDYLKGFGKQFVSAREICRRAGGKKRWEKNPHWAIPLLNGLVDKKIIETDSMAHYRIRPEKEEKKQWMSPEIAKLLKEKGLEDKKEEPKPIEIDPPDTGEPSPP